MTLAAVKGQHRAVDALKAALRSGAIHHAWLFAGPEGVGKELAAIGFAQALTCQERPGEGCGSCASCGRIARRNHPDVQWVMPQEEQIARGLAGRSDFANTPSRDIRVEQIRTLQERLALRPLEAERKVAIVASAHRMNDPAQNAFLKTLEEPPAGTVLVLIASAPDRLLPTIRSRCLRVTFGPLPVDFIADTIQEKKKLDRESALLAATMAGGSLSAALAIDPGELTRRREVITAFEALDFDDARTLLGFAEVYGASRDDAESTLRILDLWTRDVAVARAGSDLIANRDLAAEAHRAAARTSDAELQWRHRLIGEALEVMAERNASPRMQLEKLLIDLARGAR
ncbi:MAG: DNA polymerase III subunit delta' [Myxococcaceae bacterium]|nr:DNA polymerase III subunit delta' [Myxococcaceae bacterium]